MLSSTQNEEESRSQESFRTVYQFHSGQQHHMLKWIPEYLKIMFKKYVPMSSARIKIIDMFNQQAFMVHIKRKFVLFLLQPFSFILKPSLNKILCLYYTLFPKIKTHKKGSHFITRKKTRYRNYSKSKKWDISFW